MTPFLIPSTRRVIINHKKLQSTLSFVSFSFFVVINFFLDDDEIYTFSIESKNKTSNRRSGFLVPSIHRVIIRKNRRSHSSFHLVLLLLLLLHRWWNFSSRSFWRKQMYPVFDINAQIRLQWPLTDSRVPRHYASVASLVNEWLIADRSPAGGYREIKLIRLGQSDVTFDENYQALTIKCFCQAWRSSSPRDARSVFPRILQKFSFNPSVKSSNEAKSLRNRGMFSFEDNVLNQRDLETSWLQCGNVDTWRNVLHLMGIRIRGWRFTSPTRRFRYFIIRNAIE